MAAVSGWQTGSYQSGIAGAAGTGLEIYGAIEQFGAAKDESAAALQGNAATLGRIGVEQKEDALRRTMMETQSRRASIENLRNAQRAGSLALANATSKGAQFGSGLAGGKAQIAGASAWNQEGISQNLQAGEQMFDLKGQESQFQIQTANAQLASQQARMRGQEGSAWGSIGKDLVGSMGVIKDLAPLLLL